MARSRRRRTCPDPRSARTLWPAAPQGRRAFAFRGCRISKCYATKPKASPDSTPRAHSVEIKFHPEILPNAVPLDFLGEQRHETGQWGAIEKMDYAARQTIYRQIEAERGSKCIALVTGERGGLQTIIAPDAVEPFVNLLDAIGPTPKLSLVLDTNGGNTSAAWRLINLFRSFGDEFEVIVPTKAMSAGTLISLGANRIVMTKQAALGPIDPSLANHPLNPIVGPPVLPSPQMVNVSAEAVRGYLEEANRHVSDPVAAAAIWTHLATQIHPIVLGEIFRLGGQIRSMAKTLIRNQVEDEDTQDRIINLLCSDSGSHDYTINRRFAAEIGLQIEKCSAALYPMLSALIKSYHAELKTFEPHSPMDLLAGQARASYTLVRGLIESTEAGCFGFVSEGELEFSQLPGAPSGNLSDRKKFEGWRKMP